MAQVIVEIAVAAVVPVILAADSRVKAASFEQGDLPLLRKQAMHGGRTALHREGRGCRDQGLAYSAPLRRVGDQQAGSRARGIGRGRHELGIIGLTGAVIGLGPGPIEDEFSPRMLFEIARQGADQRIVLPGQHMAGLPAAVAAHRTVVLECGQEFVTHEGIVPAEQGIQRSDVDGVHLVGEGDAHSEDSIGSGAARVGGTDARAPTIKIIYVEHRPQLIRDVESSMLRRALPLLVMAALAGMHIAPTLAAELTAEQIVTKASQVDGGGDGGVDSKLRFFSEFPPDVRGKAFMGYIFSDDRMDDHWLYLPELRMVRKMNHDMHAHHREDDEFAPSALTRGDLVPRAPAADRHRLVGEEAGEGRAYYMVGSVPEDEADENYPYSKTVKWIAKDNFLTERIDYYRGGDQAAKRQHIKWKKLDKFWEWEQVVGEDLKDGSRTMLDISDIRVNVGLKDQAFTARSLRNGIESVLR